MEHRARLLPFREEHTGTNTTLGCRVCAITECRARMQRSGDTRRPSVRSVIRWLNPRPGPSGAMAVSRTLRFRFVDRGGRPGSTHALGHGPDSQRQGDATQPRHRRPATTPSLALVKRRDRRLRLDANSPKTVTRLGRRSRWQDGQIRPRDHERYRTCRCLRLRSGNGGSGAPGRKCRLHGATRPRCGT